MVDPVIVPTGAGIVSVVKTVDRPYGSGLAGWYREYEVTITPRSGRKLKEANVTHTYTNSESAPIHLTDRYTSLKFSIVEWSTYDPEDPSSWAKQVVTSFKVLFDDAEDTGVLLYGSNGKLLFGINNGGKLIYQG